MELVLRVNVIYRGSIVLYKHVSQDLLDRNGKLTTFIALAFRNGMGYRYLNMRVNSVNDVCILCENFPKFGAVTPELTGLICERRRHIPRLAKRGVVKI